MAAFTSKKPIHRSQLRMALGSIYFSMKRFLGWHFSGRAWARRRVDPAPYPHVIFTHRTPLYRKLKNVDMWLQENKVKNLKIAVPKVSGICLEPGETFSYWRLLGSPSARKGYVEGMALHNGQLRVEVAGGLCQLSNLIYWMTLHTPLTVVERWRHNYDVFPDANRTLPFGSGATCFYNYVDLQFRNDTDQKFVLNIYLTDDDLVGEWRSDRPWSHRYQVYESEHRIDHEPWGGYSRHNSLRRRVLNKVEVDEADEVVEDQFITENHAIMMYQPLLGAGND